MILDIFGRGNEGVVTVKQPAEIGDDEPNPPGIISLFNSIKQTFPDLAPTSPMAYHGPFTYSTTFL